MKISIQVLLSKTTRNLFITTLFFAPFIFIPWFRDCAELPRNCFLQAANSLILFLWLLGKTLDSEESVEFQIPTTIGPMIIFLLWGLLSFVYAINEWEVLYRWTTWLTAFLAFFLACNLFTKRAETNILLRILFYASTGIAIIGISQHLFGLDIIPQSAPPASTFVNRNMAVHIIILCMPLSLPLMFDNEHSFSDFLIPVCFSLQATYLIYTTTRSGWLASIVQLIFTSSILVPKVKNYLPVTQNKKKGIVLGLLIFLSLVGLGRNGNFSGLALLHNRIIDTRYQVQTKGAEVRWAYWANSFAILKDHPLLGVGLGNFKIYYPRYHNAYLPDRSFTASIQTADVHNDFIQLFVELGLIGFLLALWATTKTYKCLQVLIKNKKTNEELLLLTGITAGIVGSLVSMTFSFPMQLSLPPVILLVYLALLHSLAKAQSTLVLAKKKCLLITIGIGVYCLKVLSNQLGILQAEHFNTKSMRQALANNYKSAAETALVAYKHQPLWHKSLYQGGTAFLRSSTPTYAIEPIKKYLDSYPYDINALSSLGAALTENGQYDLAEYHIRQSLELLPDNWPAYNHLGNLFLQQERYTEAISAFQEAISSHKNNSKLWYNLAVTKAKVGDYHSAIDDFSEAERLEPGWKDPLEKIATLKKKLKND